jgi:hypothetical protein
LEVLLSTTSGIALPGAEDELAALAVVDGAAAVELAGVDEAGVDVGAVGLDEPFEVAETGEAVRSAAW